MAPLLGKLTVETVAEGSEVATEKQEKTRSEVRFAAQGRVLDGAMTLKVRDDGKGISPELGKSTGIGRRTIEDRVKLLNGSFALHTPATGSGAQVTIQIPIAP